MSEAIGPLASIIGGFQQKSAADYNAGVMRQEGAAAMQQSVTAEDTQRRGARESLGRTSAAIGASGTGYGGSSAGVMDQAAVNAELDALNLRYRGVFTKYGYDAESQIQKQRGNMAALNGVLNAGASLIKGSSGNYAMGIN